MHFRSFMSWQWPFASPSALRRYASRKQHTVRCSLHGSRYFVPNTPKTPPRRQFRMADMYGIVTDGDVPDIHNHIYNQLPSPHPNPIFYNSAVIEEDRPIMDGKFTLGMDCVALLKPDEGDSEYAVSKSPNETALLLHLPTLLPIPTLGTIKIKAIHTCGPIERKEGHCLTALWTMEDWFVEQYQRYGKRVECKRFENDTHAYDTADPDFMLTVFIKRGASSTGSRGVVRA